MKAGDVVLVRFPFTDVSTEKKRPALVLAQTVRSPRNRLATVATIDQDLVDKKLGRLSERDLKAARAAFRQVFAPWVD